MTTMQREADTVYDPVPPLFNRASTGASVY